MTTTEDNALPNSLRQWTVYDSAQDVLNSLASWLESHVGWRYELRYGAPLLLEKVGHVRLVTGDAGEGSVSINGRGDTAHETTVEAFNLAGVPHPKRVLGDEETRPDADDSGITVDDGLRVRSLSSKEVTREVLEGF